MTDTHTSPVTAELFSVEKILRFYSREAQVFDHSNDTVVVKRQLLISAADEIDRLSRPVQLPASPVTSDRDAMVKKISMAMADGKDSGGYDTLLDMYAHTALKVIEDSRPAQCVLPAGYVAAPTEPTFQMKQAGYTAFIQANKTQVFGEAIADRMYRAMLADLPSTPGGQERKPCGCGIMCQDLGKEAGCRFLQPERDTLRKLVAIVYQHATESTMVPATLTADLLIDRAFGVGTAVTSTDGAWCEHCGCGNDALGYKHLETCGRTSTDGGGK